MGSVGELSKVCSQIVLRCLYLASIGRPDILWSVSKLAREVTKWTKACDKRLARLISQIHHTSEYRQYCYVGETQHNNGDLDYLTSLMLQETLKTQNQHQKRCLVYFRASKLDVQETGFSSHSSTDAEIISLDAGLRILWDLVIEVFHSEPNKTEGPKREQLGNPSAIVKTNMHNPTPIKHNNVIPTNIDHIPSNAKNSDSSAMLYVFEDIEAVIKMITKGRSLTKRHVSRTHRVALDWLFDRIN